MKLHIRAGSYSLGSLTLAWVTVGKRLAMMLDMCSGLRKACVLDSQNNQKVKVYSTLALRSKIKDLREERRKKQATEK